MAGAEFQKARWLRDLHRFLPLKSQFVLSGNIRDLQAYEVSEGVIGVVPLLNALGSELSAAGYADVLTYQSVTGFRAVDLGAKRTMRKHGPVSD